MLICLAAGLAGFAWQALPVNPLKPRRDSLAAGGITLLFGLVDWLLAAALPRGNVSYGPVTPTLFFLLFSRLAALVFIGLAWDIGRRYRGWFLQPKGIVTGLSVLGAFNLIILAGAFDVLVVEPFRLQVSQVNLVGPFPAQEAPLRILHISDLHLERTTRREEDFVSLSKTLQPDLILLTGDYVNLDFQNDRQTWQETRTLLAQLSAPYGVYAVSGTPGVDTPENLEFIFAGLDIHLLQDEIEVIEIRGQEFSLLGIKNLGYERDRMVLADLSRQLPEDSYPILLYHTPDLIKTAAQAGIDLYLAGHTHGGQVRMPFYGALVTFSRYGKAYESGLFHEGSTSLYVSRGLGMEGMGMPRVRFLCPPEIALIEVGGNER